MEGQINLSDIEVTLTPLMMVLAVPISFAIQFIKALTNRLEFFKADEVKKSFFPIVSIGLTCLAYWLAGITDWIISGVVMGLAASGGYQAFAGSAKLVNKNKPAVTTAVVLMLCSALIFGCGTLRSDPNAELKASADIFTAVANSLYVLKENGKLTPDEEKQIAMLIELGNTYLVEWRQALRDKTPTADIIKKFNEKLDKLIAYQTLKGGD